MAHENLSAERKPENRLYWLQESIRKFVAIQWSFPQTPVPKLNSGGKVGTSESE